MHIVNETLKFMQNIKTATNKRLYRSAFQRTNLYFKNCDEHCLSCCCYYYFTWNKVVFFAVLFNIVVESFFFLVFTLYLNGATSINTGIIHNAPVIIINQCVQDSTFFFIYCRSGQWVRLQEDFVFLFVFLPILFLPRNHFKSRCH